MKQEVLTAAIAENIFGTRSWGPQWAHNDRISWTGSRALYLHLQPSVRLQAKLSSRGLGVKNLDNGCNIRVED